MDLVRYVEEHILGFVERTDDDRLPPVRVLSKQLGVRTATVLEALNRLRTKGILEFRQGAPVRIVDRKRPGRIQSVKPPFRSPEQVAERIIKGIREGRYRAGTPLPKLYRLAEEQGVSVGTVGKACRLLGARGIVYKSGKGWIPGKPRTRKAGGGATHYLEVIVPRVGVWLRYREGRTAGIIRSIVTESDRSGLVLLLRTASSDYRSSKPVVSSLEKNAKVAVTTVVGRIILGRRHEYKDLKSLVGSLPLSSAPTAWIDDSETLAPLEVSNPRFHQYGYSEKEFSSKALDYLLETGHRSIAFYSTPGRQEGPWIGRRWRILKSHLPVSSGGSLVNVKSQGEQILSMLREELSATLRRNGECGQEFCRKLIDFFIRAADNVAESSDRLDKANAGDEYDSAAALMQLLLKPKAGIVGPFPYLRDTDTLCPLALSPSLSALIISNDAVAPRIQNALTQMGVVLGQDISVVSYDNVADPVLVPFDSVDNGSSFLGYRAFHTILGDIPVPQRPVHLAVPTVAPRGSVRTLSV